MLLSIQQKYILEVVQTLGYIQRRQLRILMYRQFHPLGHEVTESGMNAMLRQLRAYHQDIRLDDHGVWIAGVQPDPLRLEAVNVMLELSGDTPVELHTGSSAPLLLRFLIDGPKVSLFAVANLSTVIPDSLKGQRMERIIWISADGVAPTGLTLPPKHFFAARRPDGSHQFYSSKEP